jgi:2,3-dihydroxy-p-cumate/2,3-dihydroxybenzoate 3,4-dioxygenase
MIRHIVAFSFKEATSPVEREQLLAELRALPSAYPSMRRFAIGTNISRRDATFSHAFSVEFNSIEELNDYLESERHEKFVAERFRPIVEQRAIVSFET